MIIIAVQLIVIVSLKNILISMSINTRLRRDQYMIENIIGTIGFEVTPPAIVLVAINPTDPILHAKFNFL